MANDKRSKKNYKRILPGHATYKKIKDAIYDWLAKGGYFA
jgi:hypothetical protein